MRYFDFSAELLTYFNNIQKMRLTGASDSCLQRSCQVSCLFLETSSTQTQCHYHLPKETIVRFCCRRQDRLYPEFFSWKSDSMINCTQLQLGQSDWFSKDLKREYDNEGEQKGITWNYVNGKLQKNEVENHHKIINDLVRWARQCRVCNLVGFSFL